MPSLVTVRWRPTLSLPQTPIRSLFPQLIYRTCLSGRCHMDFTKIFDVVTFNLYLIYFVPQDLCML